MPKNKGILRHSRAGGNLEMGKRTQNTNLDSRLRGNDKAEV